VTIYHTEFVQDFIRKIYRLDPDSKDVNERIARNNLDTDELKNRIQKAYGVELKTIGDNNDFYELILKTIVELLQRLD